MPTRDVTSKAVDRYFLKQADKAAAIRTVYDTFFSLLNATGEGPSVAKGIFEREFGAIGTLKKSYGNRHVLIDAYVNVFSSMFHPPSSRTEIDAWIQGEMVLTPDQIGALFSNDFNLSQKNSDSYIVSLRTQIMETESEDTRIMLIQKFYESALPKMSRKDPFCHQIINEIRVQLTAWENFSPDGITGIQLVLESINPPKDPPYRDVGARFRIALVLADDVSTRHALRCIFSHLFPDMQSLGDPIDGVNVALNGGNVLEYRMLKALDALSRIESVSDDERTRLEQIIGNAPYLGHMNGQRLLRWVPTPPSIDRCRELLAGPGSDSYLLSLGRLESMCRTPWGANSSAAFEMINDSLTEWLGGHPGDDGVVLRVMSSMFQLLDSETLWCSIINFSPVTAHDSRGHGDLWLTGQLQALGTHQKMRNSPIDPGRMDELVDSQERLILVSEWTNAQKVNVLTHLYSLSPSRMNLPQVMSTGRGDKIRRQGGRSELLLKAALLAQRMAAPWLVPLIAPRSQIRSFQSLYSTGPDGATQLYSDIEALQTFTDFRHTDLGSAVPLLAGITPNVGLRIILGGVSIPGYVVGKMQALRALIQSELARKISQIEIRSLEGRRRIILTRVIQFLAFPQDAVAQFVHLAGGPINVARALTLTTVYEAMSAVERIRMGSIVCGEMTLVLSREREALLAIDGEIGARLLGLFDTAMKRIGWKPSGTQSATSNESGPAVKRARHNEPDT